jgi:hypothetical protein
MYELLIPNLVYPDQREFERINDMSSGLLTQAVNVIIALSKVEADETAEK